MGFCPPYMLFSFQHTTGSWTGDPQGSFPSFVAFCSPTLHDKDLIFPIFMDTPEYYTGTVLVHNTNDKTDPIASATFPSFHLFFSLPPWRAFFLDRNSLAVSGGREGPIGRLEPHIYFRLLEKKRAIPTNPFLMPP